MKAKCLIIDDEPFAHRVIENFVQDIPSLQIIKNCYTALEALEFMHTQAVDIIFLDIQMPKLSGISFLKSLEQKPQVIVTTAFKEYAIEGFDLDVCDYLLKPFSFERFLKAINKAIGHLTKSRPDKNQVAEVAELPPASLYIKADKKIHKVALSEIYYFESWGSYVKVHLKDNFILTMDSLKNFEASLPAALFIRIHRSTLVAVDKIKMVEGNQVWINDTKLPIGNFYRMNLTKIMKQ